MTHPTNLQLFDLTPDTTKVCGALAARFGACKEALDWLAIHDVDEMVLTDIKDPYLPGWGQWTFLNMGHRFTPALRMHILKAVAKDPFVACQLWLQATDLTPAEAEVLKASAAAEYPEWEKKRAKAEITKGCQSDLVTKVLDPDG